MRVSERTSERIKAIMNHCVQQTARSFARSALLAQLCSAVSHSFARSLAPSLPSLWESVIHGKYDTLKDVRNKIRRVLSLMTNEVWGECHVFAPYS